MRNESNALYCNGNSIPIRIKFPKGEYGEIIKQATFFGGCNNGGKGCPIAEWLDKVYGVDKNEENINKTN